tara:strand:+ start:372 stop:659 length:288 start_codon:yes stop_codon:yes gene_type:complete
MSKIKELSKIKTRYSNLNEWNDTSHRNLSKRWSKSMDDTRDGLTELEKKEGIAHPTNQKYDFKKPTLVHLSRKELEILYTTGRIETHGITITYEQ